MSFFKILFSLSLLLSLSLFADVYEKSAQTKPVLTQKGAQKEWCPVCGMKLESFYKTSHFATLENSKERQYCSIRCLAVDMQEYTIDLSSVRVVDAKSEKVIKADDAFYVLASDVAGTMTKVSKLAFEHKKDALEFIKQHGGKLVSFKEALSAAQDSLASDVAMVQMKKKKKVYPMGEKIYEKMCTHDIDPTNYLEINELKAALVEQKLCKPLAEKQLQALSLYLWEVKRFGDLKALGEVVTVEQDEKCPVCGMFVAKYPRWAAQIFYGETHFSFDGVKDLMKFYYEPTHWGKYESFTQEKITKLLVTDYYSQKAIDGRNAFYVLGSDVYGPMGNELIPFASKNDAKTFLMDHKGAKILHFKEIRVEDVYKLDE
jgi:copper chaperone NosL